MSMRYDRDGINRMAVALDRVATVVLVLAVLAALYYVLKRALQSTLTLEGAIVNTVWDLLLGYVSALLLRVAAIVMLAVVRIEASIRPIASEPSRE